MHMHPQLPLGHGWMRSYKGVVTTNMYPCTRLDCPHRAIYSLQPTINLMSDVLISNAFEHQGMTRWINDLDAGRHSCGAYLVIMGAQGQTTIMNRYVGPFQS